MTYIDEDGQERYRDRVRTSRDGRTGFGWNPFHHHTVSRVPQNCDTCHPVQPGAGPDNQARLSETYGFGNGRFQSEDGEDIFVHYSDVHGEEDLDVGDLVGFLVEEVPSGQMAVNVFKSG